MADTYTTRNRLIKPEIGQYTNAWGGVLNLQNFDLVDAAIDGMAGFTLTGAKTLSSNNAAADESRMRFLKITGGTGGTITIPSVEKWYIVRNGSSGNAVFSAGGTTATVAAGLLTIVVCDASDCYTMDFTAAAAAAVVAQLAAEAAQLAAETAQGLAEAAQTGAETAETNAETAQGLAEAARDAAVVAQGLAEAAQAATEAVLADAIAAGSILPVQTGNSGKFLTTNGTTPSWVTNTPTLIQTITTGTISSGLEFASIPAGYSELWIVWEHIISSAPADVYYRIATQERTAGTWKGYSRVGTGAFSGADTYRGSAYFFAADQDSGPVLASFDATNSNTLSGATVFGAGIRRGVGGISGIRLDVEFTGSLTGTHSVKLYGRS